MPKTTTRNRNSPTHTHTHRFDITSTMDLVEQCEARETEARACFAELDADGSGAIDSTELTAALTELGMKKPGTTEAAFDVVVQRWLGSPVDDSQQLMTASIIVHVTNRVTPGSGWLNPRRAYGQKHRLMTAGVVLRDSRCGRCNQSDTRE